MVFYPPAPNGGAVGRRVDLLVDLTDHEYSCACAAVSSRADINFLDAESFILSARRIGKHASIVMQHVASWINSKPTQVQPSANQKPPIWEDFLPAIHSTHHQASTETVKRIALDLQAKVISHVSAYYNEFKDPAIVNYMVRL